MRKTVHVEEDGRKRSVVTYDSFTDLIDSNRDGEDHRSAYMDDVSFYGCSDMKEADQMARRGLPKVGVEAINLAKQNVALMNGQLVQRAFYEGHDTAGAFVDMGRFVEGQPECMVEFFPTEEPNQNKIVALILNVSYNCMISAEAIKKNGQAMMSLVEAVEMSGMQTEIWTDMYVRGGDTYARTAVRLKRAGEPFDVGMFMYALTSNTYLRAHLFNAMHSHGADIRKRCGIFDGGGYGTPVTVATDMDDFPPYSIYIPSIKRDAQAGEFVPRVLKQLNLLKDAS
jgi:hypothetical protein